MSLTLSSLSAKLEKKQTLYFSRRIDQFFLRGKQIVFVQNDAERVFELSILRRVVILGRPLVECSVLYRLLRAGIPVDWLDIFGRPMGILLPAESQSVPLARKQEDFCESSNALELMRQILLAKIDNGRTVLRNRLLPSNPALQELRKRVQNAATPSSLRGMEGMATHLYFGEWKGLVKKFPWTGRHAHPTVDPVNALLSFGYSLLDNRCVSALHFYGLDVRRGFFHAAQGTHCSLASDLMEDLRHAVKLVLPKHGTQPTHRRWAVWHRCF